MEEHTRPFFQVGFLRMTWHDVFAVHPTTTHVIVKTDGQAIAYENTKRLGYLGETGDHFTPNYELCYERPENIPMPCPYCGSQAEVLQTMPTYVYFVECSNEKCHARGSCRSNEQTAVHIWDKVARHFINQHDDEIPF